MTVGTSASINGNGWTRGVMSNQLASAALTQSTKLTNNGDVLIIILIDRAEDIVFWSTIDLLLHCLSVILKLPWLSNHLFIWFWIDFQNWLQWGWSYAYNNRESSSSCFPAFQNATYRPHWTTREVCSSNRASPTYLCVSIVVSHRCK